MSLTQYLNTVPFSLTGIQNANTINGNQPVDSITITGQTSYLSSSAVDINGNVNLNLHIPTGSSSAIGLNYDLTQTNNLWAGTQDFTNTGLKMTLTNADTGFHIGYDPITRQLTYNQDASSDLLDSNNVWVGTQDFTNNNLKMTLTNADTGYYVSYNPSTRSLTYNQDSASNILDSNNTWNGIQTFQQNTYFNNNIWFTTITNGGTPARGYIATDGADYYAIYVPKTGTGAVYNVIKFQNNGYIEIGDATSPQNVLIRPTTYFNNGLRVYWNATTQMFWIEDATDVYMRLGTSNNSGYTVQFDTTSKKLTYTTNLSVAQSLLSQNNSWSGTNTYTNNMYFGDTAFGIYKPASTVLRIGHITGGGAPPSTQAFLDFDNAGGSALYGNNYFGLNTPTFNIAGNTYVASSKFIKFNNALTNNKLILWGNDDNNAYSLGIDGGTQLYNSGGIHSFWTGSRAYNPCKISSDGVLCIGTGGQYGTHGTLRGLYVCGDWGEISNGAEFRHSNGTQGVGIGYAGIYATGSNANQTLSFKSKGASSSLNYYVENQLVQACSASNFNIYSPVMTWANGGFMGQYGTSTNPGERWTNNWCRFAESQSNEARALSFARNGDLNYMVSLAPYRFWMPFRYVGGNFNINYQGSGYDTAIFFSGGTVHYYSSGYDLIWMRFDTGDRFVAWCNAGGSYFYVNNSNNYGIASDARLKKDITAIDINKSFDFITKITPSVFRYKVSDEHDSRSIGFIAQDVLLCAKTEAQKNIVNRWREYEDAMAKGEEPIEEYDDEKEKDENGKPKRKTRKIYLGVSEVKFIPEIIGCIQVMNKENEELKAEVASLTKENQELRQKVSSLEERLSRIEKLLDLS